MQTGAVDAADHAYNDLSVSDYLGSQLEVPEVVTGRSPPGSPQPSLL